MDQQTCSTCAHFRQHYAFDKRKLFRVYCGHCTCGKAKSKRPDAKACEHHQHADHDESAFVTKEYLSRSLLEYLLRLELLPEIYEAK